MDKSLKLLISVACIAVVAASGVFLYDRFSGREERIALIATPRKIAQCEKEVAAIILKSSEQTFEEGYGRYAAIRITDCEDHGLVSPAQKSTVMRSGLASYIEEFQKNRNVWVKE